MHLLLFDNKSLGGPTNNYLSNMDIGVLEPDAFAQAFPFDKNGLDQALHKLIKDRVIRLMTVTYGQGVSVDEAPISAMTPAHADAQMARDGGREDIEDLASTLEKGGTGDAQLRIDVAATLLHLSQSKLSGDRAFAILDDLVHTGSAPLEAVGLWADAAQLTVVNWATMVPVLESNAARAPHKTDLLRELARVHERLGGADKARECYDRIILLSDNPEERLWTQKQEDSARGRR